MNNKKTKNTSFEKMGQENTGGTVVKKISTPPEQEKIIQHNILRWQKYDKIRKEINSLGARTRKLIKRLTEAEKSDPTVPLVRAIGDYNSKIKGIKNFQQFYSKKDK